MSKSRSSYFENFCSNSLRGFYLCRRTCLTTFRLTLVSNRWLVFSKSILFCRSFMQSWKLYRDNLWYSIVCSNNVFQASKNSTLAIKAKFQTQRSSAFLFRVVIWDFKDTLSSQLTWFNYPPHCSFGLVPTVITSVFPLKLWTIVHLIVQPTHLMWTTML